MFYWMIFIAVEVFLLMLVAGIDYRKGRKGEAVGDVIGAFLVLVAGIIASPDSVAQTDFTPVNTSPMETEIRYCGAPAYDSNGKILRSAKIISAFKRAHPCPVDGSTTGSCPGWAIDHVIPLACGGCDAVFNMQWLPDGLKNASGTLPKDRWERSVYANKLAYDGPSCQFKVITK